MTANAGSNRPFEILLVEDNPGDVVLTREAFEEAHIAVNLHVCESGEDATSFLALAASDAAQSRPDLALLDLNLPGMSGIELLNFIRGHAAFSRLPVIMLTSSAAPEDVTAAYREHANSFISKPVNPSEFLDAVRAIGSYWLTIVQLPSEA